MKVSYNHLKSFVDFDLSPEQLGVLLTNTGLEVEGIEKIDNIKGGLEGLIVGEVMACEKHPDADRLKTTKINIGQAELLDIVCGAANVAAGQKVIVATVGTTLYPVGGEPFSIKKSKIRGAVSEGMICAEDEIGLGSSHDGIMVLDASLEVGTPISQVFNIVPDYQFEIGLTPNRADAASHMGVARDIKAVLDTNMKLPSVESFKLGTASSTIDLEVQDATLCPRFCGLEIQGVTVQESPKWLKEFLNVIGVNSINNIVDITNYVCHYLGQPMHIFDSDKISGNKIIVKVPAKDTALQTLDGLDRKLSGFDLAICNASNPMAIAGVFGGKGTGVLADTKNIFLEVAYFNPTSVRKTATFHSLKTDASFRYERGTDPNMPPFAIKFAALLIQELAGGQICDKMFDVYPTPISNFELSLKKRNIDRLIGKKIGEEQIRSILGNLDIVIKSESADVFELSIPPYRVDVQREADVIEEILRIYGFDNVELSDGLSTDFISNFPAKNEEDLRLRITEALASKGLNEILTLSIVKPKDNSSFNEGVIKLLNPLSEDLSEMRMSLLNSGLSTLLYNINRRAKDLKVFEFGRTYSKSTEGKIKEQKTLAIWLTGKKTAESWQGKAQNVDFAILSQLVFDVLSLFRINSQSTSELESPTFEYGLEHIVRNKTLVSFGKLSIQTLKQADIKQDVFYAEFDWNLMMKMYSPEIKFQEIPKYPEVRRDLSLVLDKAIKFEAINKIAYNIEKKLLKDVNVFDIYEGEKLENGKKSYSVSFMLQDFEKTLNDTQIDKTMAKLMQAFENELNAQIRK